MIKSPHETYFREKHPGSFDICHIKDGNGHVFATRLNYVFTIGKVKAVLCFIVIIYISETICSILQGNKPFISLPKGKGVKLSIAEERDKRLGL